MIQRMNQKTEETIARLAFQLGISKDSVVKIYKYFWRYIKETIESLPLNKDLSEEEFSRLRTNFAIPYIGKLYCTYNDYKVTKERYAKHKNDKADVQSTGNNG